MNNFIRENNNSQAGGAADREADIALMDLVHSESEFQT